MTLKNFLTPFYSKNTEITNNNIQFFQLIIVDYIFYVNKFLTLLPFVMSEKSSEKIHGTQRRTFFTWSSYTQYPINGLMLLSHYK